MTIHYLSGPDTLADGRAIVLGTEHTSDRAAVTCGNCKRSRAFRDKVAEQRAWEIELSAHAAGIEIDETATATELIAHHATINTVHLDSGLVAYSADCGCGYGSGLHATGQDAYDVATGHGKVSRPLYTSASGDLDTMSDVPGTFRAAGGKHKNSRRNRRFRKGA